MLWILGSERENVVAVEAYQMISGKFGPDVAEELAEFFGKRAKDL